MINQCHSCKYFEQGKTCCFCSHPDQKEDYKGYVYYNFSCNLHEDGIADSRIEYMKSIGRYDEYLLKQKNETTD